MPARDEPGKNLQADSLWKLIGRTPLAAVKYAFRGEEPREVLVKLEQFNLTGSVKDRVALYLLEKAREKGALTAGDVILDAAQGNMALSLAAVGRALGHKVKLLLPSGISLELRAAVKGYGAEVQLVGEEQGGYAGAVKMIEGMTYLNQVFLPRRFAYPYLAEAHERTTGREIAHALILEGLEPGAFVAAAGSGATLLGVCKYLRTLYPAVSVHMAEPLGSPAGQRIPGVGEGSPDRLGGLKALDEPVTVADGDAVLMTRALRAMGLSVGLSSGLNFLAAVKLQQSRTGERAVITLFPDDDKRYGMMDAFREEPVLPGYLTPHLELMGYRYLTRV